MSCADIAAIVGSVMIFTSDDPRVSDELALAPLSAYDSALCYHNHFAFVSKYTDYELEIEGLSVQVRLTWTNGHDEYIIITVPDGFIVFPSNEASILDGETITFQITKAAS